VREGTKYIHVQITARNTIYSTMSRVPYQVSPDFFVRRPHLGYSIPWRSGSFFFLYKDLFKMCSKFTAFLQGKVWCNLRIAQFQARILQREVLALEGKGRQIEWEGRPNPCVANLVVFSLFACQRMNQDTKLTAVQAKI